VGGDGVAQGPALRVGRGGLAGRAAQRCLLCTLRDVLALGEHGRDVGHDRVHRGPCGLRDRLGGLTGTDAGLDLTGTDAAAHLDLQLAETGGLTAHRRAEVGRDVEGELDALVIHQQQATTVGTDAGEGEVCLVRHVSSLVVCLGVRLPGAGVVLRLRRAYAGSAAGSGCGPGVWRCVDICCAFRPA
jgi:hypothetical protein